MNVSEAELQRLVCEAADYGGWLQFHDNDSRRNRAGFPDLVLVRAGELIIVELKAEKGRVRPDQTLWLEALSQVEFISTGILRPSNADNFVKRLTSRPSPADRKP